VTIISRSEKETEEAGAALGRTLRPGGVVALCGSLGAGKTVFVRGIARALGVTEHVTSPTYTIVNEYLCSRPLFHFDMYRLSGPDDLWEIGWEDYLDRGGVCVLEWGSIVEEALPPEAVRVHMTALDDHTREITVSGVDCS